MKLLSEKFCHLSEEDDNDDGDGISEERCWELKCVQMNMAPPVNNKCFRT